MTAMKRTMMVASCVATAAMMAAAACAQDRMSPGKSLGTVTTRGNLILLTLNEDALGKPHLFDLEHHTVRFTPDGMRYRVETIAEQWDKDFGAEIHDPHVTLTKIAFPFSGKTWNGMSVGVTGSITFGDGAGARGRGPGAVPNQQHAGDQRVLQAAYEWHALREGARGSCGDYVDAERAVCGHSGLDVEADGEPLPGGAVQGWAHRPELR